ncbi:hypothetical protein [Silvimonas iriomotensis]|uniref:Uncharacterized protein n=1 Tax=Silvimonas iriomotensis TaxID=449662 RepID=A0ABQ2P4M5_9NEIS|nr:hypothetical protein [Silvimonas iriomotensis]GGP18118.1 hypothetical protein GCM10010970_03270 [Silvimonas iriomotensis]
MRPKLPTPEDCKPGFAYIEYVGRRTLFISKSVELHCRRCGNTEHAGPLDLFHTFKTWFFINEYGLECLECKWQEFTAHPRQPADSGS